MIDVLYERLLPEFRAWKVPGGLVICRKEYGSDFLTWHVSADLSVSHHAGGEWHALNGRRRQNFVRNVFGFSLTLSDL